MTKKSEPFMFEQCPDILAHEKYRPAGTIAEVGMEDIEVPVRLESNVGTHFQMALAKATVSLDKAEAKGIHMSRLYLALQEALSQHVLSQKLLQKTLSDFLHSHKGLSKRAKLELNYKLPLQQASLLSKNTAWRQYPIKRTASIANNCYQEWIEFKILYSSTCPCSTALARQINANAFKKAFKTENPNEQVSIGEVAEWLKSEKGLAAIPHSQRSEAKIACRIDSELDLAELIHLFEKTLQTPVQALVKREDEQEFARLNAENLMFAEDAIRRLENFCKQNKSIKDYKIHVSHHESLHPHNAMAFTYKDYK